MIKRSINSIATTWLAGLLALLPLALTALVLLWAFSLVNRFIGPGSFVGGLFAALGYPFSANPVLAYVIGTLLLVAAIYLLGVLVTVGLGAPIKKLADRTVRRIPLIGGLYSVADRFVAVLDQDKGTDIAGMSPVWCFFGGDGAAVLALAPSSSPTDIEGRSYLAVLIPTAPVPFGGALLYVPHEWIRPADFGVDKLTAVYVSMGLTPPGATRTP